MPCRILDLGHRRELKLWIETTDAPLQALATHEHWGAVYDRLAELILQHRTTLIFVNRRSLAERVAHELGIRVGKEHVSGHHGSLSKERRHVMEQRLKTGDLKAVVATASLELGIDIGSVDLVCQIGSPRRIATFLQRVGRSGHALGLIPHGALFPTALDELIECAAMVRAVERGDLDRICQPKAPIEVLAQQIVAETASEEEWREDDLYAMMRRAAPYGELERSAFDDTIDMLATGIGEGGGRSNPLLHRDRINGVVKPRRAARMTAILNGGTIPETGDYRVIKEPEGAFIGTVNEDFRDRDRGRRHLPAGQHLVEDPAGREQGHCAGRGRARRSADDSISGWARRRDAVSSCRRRWVNCGATLARWRTIRSRRQAVPAARVPHAGDRGRADGRVPGGGAGVVAGDAVRHRCSLRAVLR